MVNDTTIVPLQKLIQFYKIIPIDILLIEGYKRADYAKIVLIQDQRDLHLLDELSNIVAVGVKDDKFIQPLDCYTFSLAELDLPELTNHISTLL